MKNKKHGPDDDIFLSYSEVRRVFPEARITTSSGHTEYNAHCPFGHRKGPENYKLYINAHTGTYYCQDCHSTGSAWKRWFSPTLNMRRRRGVIRVVPNQHSSGGRSYIDHVKKWRDGVPAPGDITPVGELQPDHPARQYLRSRGYGETPVTTLDNARNGFPAYYCSKGFFNFKRLEMTTTGRIIFPVTRNGLLVGWTSRMIDFTDEGGDLRRVWTGSRYRDVLRDEHGKWRDSATPKYFALPGFSKSMHLYNFDAAKEFDTVAMMEGPLDVWRFGLDSVGYMQEVPSEHQCRMAVATWKSIIWIRDNGVDTESPRYKSAIQVLSEAEEFVTFEIRGASDPGNSTRLDMLKQMVESMDHKNQPQPEADE